MNQYLTLPDGSLPENVSQEYLESLGILIVRPTEPPTDPGMVAIEGPPQQIDGVWWQTWTLEPAPPPARLPAPVITRRQLLLILMQKSVITEAEAIAAAKTGEVPATVQQYFATLPAADAVIAEISWAAMSECHIDSPFVVGMANYLMLPEMELHAWFVEASML